MPTDTERSSVLDLDGLPSDAGCGRVRASLLRPRGPAEARLPELRPVLRQVHRDNRHVPRHSSAPARAGKHPMIEKQPKTPFLTSHARGTSSTRGRFSWPRVSLRWSALRFPSITGRSFSYIRGGALNCVNFFDACVAKNLFLWEGLKRVPRWHPKKKEACPKRKQHRYR